MWILLSNPNFISITDCYTISDDKELLKKQSYGNEVFLFKFSNYFVQILYGVENFMVVKCRVIYWYLQFKGILKCKGVRGWVAEYQEFGLNSVMRMLKD